jgi:exodeoxyribonuclease VII large subunit
MIATTYGPPIGSTAQAAPRKVYSVSRIVRRADAVLREKAPPLWVRGEVSGWKRMSSGHCYFTLKDAQAELCCTLWASAARLLPTLPENGMEVEVFGQLGIYPRKGQFQLDVSRLEKTGAGGLWELAKERLLKQLRQEGLLDEDRKRPLPPHPDCIGIVTSTQSAAFHDMHRALRRKAWWMPARISHCGVEGAEAASEIAAAIRRFGTRRDQCPADVVIVARGGGSMESLWAFNMEPVARAIAACPVPVISAVGHETDYTVADVVADVRAATPTAGAERAVPDGREIAAWLDEFRHDSRLRIDRAADRREEQLLRHYDAVHRAISRRLALLGSETEAAARHLGAHSPRQVLARAEEQALRSEEALHAVMERRLEGLERELAAGAEALDARSPLRVIARGYAVVSDAETGQLVREAEQVQPDQRLRVRLAHGEIAVRAEAEPMASPSHVA